MTNLRQIVVDLDDNGGLSDITFYFQGSQEPFNEREFAPGSSTRIQLEGIIAKLEDTFPIP